MRLSRGRSTPTRRAMWRFLVCSRSGFWSCRAPSRLGWAPAIAPEVSSVRLGGPSDHGCIELLFRPSCRKRLRGSGLLVRQAGRDPSALPLLVAGVLADDHDPAVTADDLALVTDGLDARVDLHVNNIPCYSAGLLVAVDDPTPGEVVRRELHHDPVLGEDPDVVLTHLAADVREHLVPVGQLHAEHGVGKGLHDGALDLDHAFFLRHVLHNLLQCWIKMLVSTVVREPPGP